MSFNKVILMGNLTRDPETRATNSGQSVTSFSIAVNDTWTKDGERQERANFIECDAWGQRGDTIAKYFTKGRQILIEGSLRQDTWDDKETGKKRSAIRVLVNGFSFINDNAGKGGAKSSAPADSPAVDDISDEPINLDDIPF